MALLPMGRESVVAMELMEILLQVIGEILAGMLGAAILAFPLWHVFKLALHPEWGPVAAFLLVAVALIERSRAGPILPMVVPFSLVAAILLWPAGAAWREDNRKLGHRWPTKAAEPDLMVALPRNPWIAPTMDGDR